MGGCAEVHSSAKDRSEVRQEENLRSKDWRNFRMFADVIEMSQFKRNVQDGKESWTVTMK